MTEQRKLAPSARGNLTMLLNAICVGCKFVSHAVRRAGVAGNDVLGAAGSSNVQGEDQKKLDIVANEVFKNVLRKSGQCCVLVTEEEEDPVFIAPPYRGEYVVVFDPLDGSSNIDCGVSIGGFVHFITTPPGRPPSPLPFPICQAPSSASTRPRPARRPRAAALPTRCGRGARWWPRATPCTAP
jgi:fructose-1,6-bisphosphatase